MPIEVGTPRARIADAAQYWSISGLMPAARVHSTALPNVRRVAVFDFDQTLAADEISIWGWDNIVDRGFGGEERVAMMRAMLQQLREQGAACAIVSFNTKTTIERALSAINLLGFFRRDLIFGRDNVKWPEEGWKKSSVIGQRILAPLGLADSELFFMDDDPSNVRDVHMAFPKCHALHVPRVGDSAPFRQLVEKPLGGIQRAHVERVLRWARGETLDGPSAPPPHGWEPHQQPSGAADADGGSPAAESDAASVAASDNSSSSSSSRPRRRGGVCSNFVPKRPSGPLARRCYMCGEHESLHPESASPREHSG